MLDYLFVSYVTMLNHPVMIEACKYGVLFGSVSPDKFLWHFSGARSRDLNISLKERQQTNSFTLPLAHASGVISILQRSIMGGVSCDH